MNSPPNDRSGLSRRERQIASLVAEGLTNRQIAQRLFISERTADGHLEHIREKLGLHRRSQIATWSIAQSPTEPPPSNLPVPLTSFIGRAGELAEVSSLLGRTGLVTITGAAGTGKTRLALELARGLRNGYAEGVWFIDLQAVKDAELVAEEVGAVVGVTDLPRGLAGRRQLIVLDNCEQVAAGCARFVQEARQTCPELRLLATSRQPLHVPGEGIWQLRPLPAPEAVDLFVDRARLVAPETDFDTVGRSLLDAVCRKLDGIPLAIELAAGRTRLMSLSDIYHRLDHRFSLLTSAEVAPINRQRTLERAVAWSYDLLPERERLLFNRLGVFEGAFFLDAAEAVVADPELPAGELSELLSQLVDRSMLVAERPPDSRTRYRLLLTMREFARDRLRDEKSLERLRESHAGYYRLLAEQAGAELDGPEQAVWLKRLEDELDEMRAVIEWGLAADPKTSLAVATSLGWFWGLRGRVAEGRRALVTALRRAEQRSLRRGQALGFAGWLARLQGDLTEGAALHAESVEVLRELDDPLELGKALVFNAEALAHADDQVAARKGWHQAIELLEPLGSSQALAYAWVELARTVVLEGHATVGREYAGRALTMFSDLGNLRAVGLCHLILAHAAHFDGDGALAWNEVVECIRDLNSAEAISDLSMALEAAAVIAAPAERGATRAVTLAGAAEALRQTFGFGPAQDSLGLAFDPSALRIELGDQALEAAWQRGLAMSSHEAVDFALERQLDGSG
jgi:predicted ATPase/DNA-binding CsgD family transcriptional regulator